MDYYGYGGNVLRIDLSSGEIATEPLDQEMAKKFIGGWGTSFKLAYDALKPGTDPFSPENPIIISAGPLVGTLTPSAAKVQLTTKFPNPASKDKELYTVAAGVGGSTRFGVMLKSAGYDHIVITGRASRPAYLSIADDEVEVCDATGLWGHADTYETIDELTRRHGRCGVFAIGKAGENLVRTAHGIVDKTSSLGRNGGGAVMGSKNLKAIAVRGTKGVKVSDRRRFMELFHSTMENIKEWPNFGRVDPGRYNFGLGAKWAKHYPGEEIYRNTKVEHLACTACVLPCRSAFRIPDGEFAGQMMRTSQFVNMGIYGRRLELTDYRESMKLIDVINRYGLDFMTTVAMLKFVSRLYERHLIGGEHTEGLELEVGNLRCYLRLVQKMAEREGLGEAMAEGWYALSRKLGVDAGEDDDGDGIVKGTSTLFDARFTAMDPLRFSNVVNPRGGHHVHSAAYTPNLPLAQIKADSENMATSEEALARVFVGDGFNTGRLQKHSEDCLGVYNSVGTCATYSRQGLLNVKLLAGFYSAATGIEVAPEEFKRAGERVWNLYKLLNVREGFTREDDVVPELWAKTIEHPLGAQRDIRLHDYFGKPLSRDDLRQMLDDYYDERGWDVEKGIPTRGKLSELGLDEFAEVLERAGG